MMIDAENSGGQLDPGLMELRANLYSIVELALIRSGITADRYVSEDRGDGILALVDAGVPKIDLVDPLMDHLDAGLRQHNHDNPLDGWLRLRIALHSGEVRRDAKGWGARDLTLTFRLSQAEAVKRCLVLAARAQCVLVTSDSFYRSVIAHGDRSIDPATYRSVDIAQPGGLTKAWLHVPGYHVPPLGAAPPGTAPDLAMSAPNGSVVYAPGRDFNDLRNGGVVNNYSGPPGDHR